MFYFRIIKTEIAYTVQRWCIQN